ncbi:MULTISPECIES: TetR/AcrR family transcriptional regulator [unclassified Streptomyces]|uniref:TetR/AcrR family transcriptional regulator n=1 Tax=unclassified Streptomyces TaxID=2593676 RepID=UPI0005642866|nr:MULTISPECIES: TetR/AcrR family transcriptional regulator [unclassified Streptomyces]
MRQETAGAEGAAGAATPRERYRTQVRTEIKAHAWEQIADAGASGLSLNAIAKRMGMSGPALYRYYAGRDELITELIRDGYRSLVDAFRAASEAAEASGVSEASAVSGASGVSEASAVSGASGASEAAASGAEARALAHALRGWALADPQRYFLVFGTPVPGYHAPDDTTGLARESMTFVLDACAALPQAALPGPAGSPGSPEVPFAVHLGQYRAWAGDRPAPPGVLHRALSFWTRLHGALSLELAGQFTGMGFDPALFFEAELDALVAAAG